jgi:hypothetical protein
MQIITVHATKIEIRWVAGFDGGVDQTFVLEYRLSKATSWNTSYPNWTGLEEDPQYFELSGLSSGSVYDIQMYARNTVGNSLKTNIISVSTTIISVPTTTISVPTTTISVPITATTTTPTPCTTIISVSKPGAGGIFYSIIRLLYSITVIYSVVSSNPIHTFNATVYKMGDNL